MYLCIVLGSTFVIHLISTLSYSVRIVGVRTSKLAISFSLFNLMVLISRTANGFLAPVLTKTVERSIMSGDTAGVLALFRGVLLVATAASIAGLLMIPTFQRVFTLAVESYNRNRSINRLFRKALTGPGRAEILGQLHAPSTAYLRLGNHGRNAARPIFLNVVVVAILSTGSLAAIYAGVLIPEFRSTANSLQPIINGVATVLLFILIDPYLAGQTDDVVVGQVSEAQFRRTVALFAGSRIVGTLVAQVLFLPVAVVLARTAALI